MNRRLVKFGNLWYAISGFKLLYNKKGEQLTCITL